MEVIIRTSAKRHSNIILKAILIAEQFIKEKYNVNSLNVEYIFSGSASHSVYFSNKHSEKYDLPVIRISTRGTLYLYARKTIGLTTSRHGIYVGIQIQIICSLIHELTHHIQFLYDRNYSEVETTKNEIEYLKNYPEYYNKLITY